MTDKTWSSIEVLSSNQRMASAVYPRHSFHWAHRHKALVMSPLLVPCSRAQAPTRRSAFLLALCAMLLALLPTFLQSEIIQYSCELARSGSVAQICTLLLPVVRCSVTWQLQRVDLSKCKLNIKGFRAWCSSFALTRCIIVMPMHLQLFLPLKGYVPINSTWTTHTPHQSMHQGDPVDGDPRDGECDACGLFRWYAYCLVGSSPRFSRRVNYQQ